MPTLKKIFFKNYKMKIKFLNISIYIFRKGVNELLVRKVKIFFII